MHRAAVVLLTLTLGIGQACAPIHAQELGITAKFHPWGRFDLGTWKTVRVETETLNEQGRVVGKSITDTKTTLVDLDNDGVTLEIQACMEVAGKRFQAEPQIVKQGFHGEPLGPSLKIKQLADGQIAIQERNIPCKSQQLESSTSNARTVTTIYFSTTTAPYILKRESVVADPEGKEISKTSVDVIALDAPLEQGIWTLRGEAKKAIKLRTVHKNANGVVTTLADFLPEVPGGVVCNTSKECDKNGRLVRQSQLKLIDYNDDPEKDRSGMFGRKRPNRRGKSSPR
jgi:hypothetical protein